MELAPGFPEALGNIFIFGMGNTGEEDMAAELEAVLSLAVEEQPEASETVQLFLKGSLIHFKPLGDFRTGCRYLNCKITTSRARYHLFLYYRKQSAFFPQTLIHAT